MVGINLEKYYKAFYDLSEGNTGDYTKTEFRKTLIKMLACELENNFINGHIYEEDIEQLQRCDYIAKLKIGYYPTCSDTKDYIYLTLFADHYFINGLKIRY